MEVLSESKSQLETQNATLVETANDLRRRIETDTAKFEKLQAALTATVKQLETDNKNLTDKLQLAALDGLRAEAVLKADQLISLARAEGIELKVIAGYRSLEQQEKLYKEKKTRVRVSTHTVVHGRFHRKQMGRLWLKIRERRQYPATNVTACTIIPGKP